MVSKETLQELEKALADLRGLCNQLVGRIKKLEEKMSEIRQMVPAKVCKDMGDKAQTMADINRPCLGHCSKDSLWAEELERLGFSSEPTDRKRN